MKAFNIQAKPSQVSDLLEAVRCLNKISFYSHKNKGKPPFSRTASYAENEKSTTHAF
jgi:hypothetical protein